MFKAFNRVNTDNVFIFFKNRFNFRLMLKFIDCIPCNAEISR